MVTSMVLTSHVRRYHRHYGGSGHVWQGRFKAFPIQEDEHYWTVLRYVERNPLRANMVPRSQDWEWSSLKPSAQRSRGSPFRRSLTKQERLDQLRQRRRDRSGTGGTTSQLEPGHAFWRCGVATSDRQITRTRGLSATTWPASPTKVECPLFPTHRITRQDAATASRFQRFAVNPPLYPVSEGRSLAGRRAQRLRIPSSRDRHRPGLPRRSTPG